MNSFNYKTILGIKIILDKVLIFKNINDYIKFKENYN